MGGIVPRGGQSWRQGMPFEMSAIYSGFATASPAMTIRRMTGVALYSPYKNFPEASLSRTDIPLKVGKGNDPKTGEARYVLSQGIHTVTLNLMAQAELASHLAGLSQYVRGVGKKGSGRRCERIVAQLMRTRTVIGVVIEPEGCDPQFPLQVVAAVAEMTKSIMFIRGTLLDFEDHVILAPDGTFDKAARIDSTAPPKPWWKFW
jgi:hypothetical protein